MKIHELTVSERIMLAEKLWDSIVDEGTPIELTEKQRLELDSRLQAFLDDQVRKSGPLRQVRQRS